MLGNRKHNASRLQALEVTTSCGVIYIMAKKQTSSTENNPALYVRVDEKSKIVIDELVAEVIKSLNSKRELGDPEPKRNEVIIKALHKGLKAYLKELK